MAYMRIVFVFVVRTSFNFLGKNGMLNGEAGLHQRAVFVFIAALILIIKRTKNLRQKILDFYAQTAVRELNTGKNTEIR